MRWVVLTDDPPGYPGGVGTWTARVTAELARRGHDVVIFGRDRAGAVAPPGVRFVPVAGPSFGRWGGEWLGVRAWRELTRADRVLATTWPAATLAARIRPDLDVVAHGSNVTRAAVRPGAWARVWGRARPWAMSRFLADHLAERGVTAPVLPAPVNVAPEPRVPGDGSRWVCVSRAIEAKGGDRFVRLCAAAGARGTFVGDGPARPAWEALATQLKADVTFTGSVPLDQVTVALRAADVVFLLPRGPEGLGLTLLEGAALGLATVGCRAGGVPEAVGPGLVLDDPDDTPGSLAAIRSWWRPERGAEAWAWCRATHGTHRCAAALDQSAGVSTWSASTRNAS